jgi:segregation and condensation protein B
MAKNNSEAQNIEQVVPPDSSGGLTFHPAADEQAPSDDLPADQIPSDTLAEGESAGEISTERVVEAILFAADEPLTPAKIVSILGTGSAREVRKIIETLNDDYTKAGHAYRVEEIAGGYQMLTLPEYNTWLRRLRHSRQESKLSPAAMETLAVVAYKQPVVRAEIEAIRGVSVGEVLNRLRELGLVKIVGRAEDVGRPRLYGTTKHFLELFGLASLEDLPAIEELQMPK